MSSWRNWGFMAFIFFFQYLSICFSSLTTSACFAKFLSAGGTLLFSHNNIYSYMKTSNAFPIACRGKLMSVLYEIFISRNQLQKRTNLWFKLKRVYKFLYSTNLMHYGIGVRNIKYLKDNCCSLWIYYNLEMYM